MSVLISFIIISLIIATHGNSHAQDDSETSIYLVDSEPFGIPYPNWTESWWNWMVSIPKGTNPALDVDGKQCQQGMQSEYPVFFLAGSLNGTVTRYCPVPSNMSLLFPATTSFCYNTDSSEIRG